MEREERIDAEREWEERPRKGRRKVGIEEEVVEGSEGSEAPSERRQSRGGMADVLNRKMGAP